MGDQFSEGGPTYAVGLNYEVPYGNRAAKSRARESELQLAREMAQVEDTIDQVRLEVDAALAGLRGASDQYAIRKKAADKSKEVVDLLLQRQKIFPEAFDQVSQLYVREILDAQQRKSAADLAIIDLTNDIATTTIELRKATGTLLSQFGEASASCDLPFEPSTVLNTVPQTNSRPGNVLQASHVIEPAAPARYPFLQSVPPTQDTIVKREYTTDLDSVATEFRPLPRFTSAEVVPSKSQSINWQSTVDTPRVRTASNSETLPPTQGNFR